MKSPICVQQLGWTRCCGADSPKTQRLCMKPGSRRLNSGSQWADFRFLLFAVKTISSTTPTWCPSPCLSWACYTNRKVTTTWPSLWYRTPSRFGGFIINIKQIFQTDISQTVPCDCFSWFQGKLQRLQHGVPAALPHPCSAQQHGLLFSQTPSFSHTCLKRHHGFEGKTPMVVNYLSVVPLLEIYLGRKPLNYCILPIFYRTEL